MKKLARLLGVTGALLYCNWLLGYWLNYRVASNGLASDLQMRGQPYSWLFVLGDVLTGLTVVAAAFLLCQRQHKLLFYLVTGYFFFGLMTAVSALIPIHCGRNLAQCAVGNGQTFSPHNITGGIASFGQFISLLALWRLSIRTKMPDWSKWLTGGFVLLWSASGLLYIYLSLKNVDGVALQHLFLILTSIGLILVPLGVEFSGTVSDPVKRYNKTVKTGGLNERILS
jgi:hypothetical protein